MADIKVERKRGPGIWPWIIGLIILLLLLWWLFAGRGDTVTNEIPPADTAVVTDTAPGMTGMPMDTGAMGGMPADTGGMGGMPMDTGTMRGDTMPR